MRGTRVWPAAAILALGSVWAGGAWMRGDVIRQQRVVQILIAAGVTGLALLIWLVLFSGLSRKARGAALGVAVLAAAFAAVLFRLRGVTGDLVPIVEPRWTASRERGPERPAAATPPPPSSSPADPAPLPPAEVPLRAVHDFPQFLGPQRDGTVSGIRLNRDWSRSPPRLIWRHAVGVGWSGFAVAGNVAVTQEQRDDEERVVAYELRTGRQLWVHADRARYEAVIAGVGPRATPTVAGGRVYTVGATGILNALDLVTGRRLWTKDLLADNGARNPEWGKSCSPLVVDDLVVVSAGGSGGRSLVAYRRESGERAWGAGDDGSSYSSPLLVELAGRRQIVILNAGSVAGHDPATGMLLWQHPWPPTQPNVSLPLPLAGDRLLVSAGYGIGSKVLEVSTSEDGAWRARLLWESPRLKSKFANLVLHRGLVYGLDDGVLVCLDPETGERRWKAGHYGHGQMLLVGDLLLVQTEQGEIVLVEPGADGHVELARHQALDGHTWNPPALAGRLLLVRNEREAALYELPVTETP